SIHETVQRRTELFIGQTVASARIWWTIPPGIAGYAARPAESIHAFVRQQRDGALQPRYRNSIWNSAADGGQRRQLFPRHCGELSTIAPSGTVQHAWPRSFRLRSGQLESHARPYVEPRTAVGVSRTVSGFERRYVGVGLRLEESRKERVDRTSGSDRIH